MQMSHAGRRIASTAAAAAAVALPIAAAGSAQANSLPLVGELPLVGNVATSTVPSAAADRLAQALPLSGLPVVGVMTSQNGSSPLAGLPIVGGMTNQIGSPLSGVPVVAGLTGQHGSSPLAGLPVIGAMTAQNGASPLAGLPVVSGLGASLNKGAVPATGYVPDSSKAAVDLAANAPAPTQSMAKESVQKAASKTAHHYYVAKHRKHHAG
jgi:hypothetical protein